MAKTIKLTNTNKLVTVDDGDFNFINQFEWWLAEDGYPTAWVGNNKLDLPHGLYRMHDLIILNNPHHDFS